MKYSEIIYEIKEFKIDRNFGRINIPVNGPEELYDAQIPFMEKFLDKLLKAEDLDLEHNEYLEIDETKIEKINEDHLENLIVKKKQFLSDLSDYGGYKKLVYSPITRDTSLELQYRLSKIILLLEKELYKRNNEKKPFQKLTLTKKIALLEELGFYNLEKLSGSDSFKTKITQLITGGSYDVISRNLKNYNLPDDKKDFKYSSFQFKQESKKMISKTKSSTREK